MVKSKVSKSKYGKRYPKAFQHQMVELHRAGHPSAEGTFGAVRSLHLGDQPVGEAGRS